MSSIHPILPGAEPFCFHHGEIGVLISHGFMGTPQSVRHIGESFARSGFSVLAPRLKGHGTHYLEMESCTAEDWYDSLEQGYLELSNSCRSVIVAGQSMGGTLALLLAHRHPEIAGIITINAALSVPGYSYLKGKRSPRFLPEDKPDIKAENVEEITYRKVPLSAIHELQRLMSQVPDTLPDIQQPILGIHSLIDHVVPPDCTDVILKQIGSVHKEKLILPNSYHVASMDHDKELIVRKGEKFIHELYAHGAIQI